LKTAQQKVPTIDRRPNRPAFHHLGPNPTQQQQQHQQQQQKMLLQKQQQQLKQQQQQQQQNGKAPQQKLFVTDNDGFVSQDQMERRGGPNQNRRNQNRVRPVRPDVVVPEFPADNLDLPYTDLSHLVTIKNV
jgi:hypothetical protein